MALEIFRLIGSVFVDTDSAEKSLQKTDKKAEGIGTRLLSVAKTAGKFAVGVAGAATAVGAAVVAVAENTREYREEQGKLLTSFETSGFAAGAARKTYEALNGVLGDSGQAVEASNHLAKLCESEQELQKWTDICTGVYATFGDSLPIEGLTEAANETAKTGALTGSLADALNWAGVNEDDFQKKLEACNTERERSALITETLNGLYSESAEKYKEINADVIAANKAQDRLNQSMAAVGGAVEPFITKGKELIANVLEKLTPVISTLANEGLPWVSNAISKVVDWVNQLAGKFSGAGISFGSVMSFLQDRFEQTMSFIQGIWTSIGQPVWSFISQAIELVRSYFAEKMPEIKTFVQNAFSDIQELWVQHLKPALTAIGNFINNVLAPAFKFVFNHVIAPVVDAAFRGIKQLWEGTLKPVFSGILDFITGIFTLNFEKAFKGLVNAIGGIWSGLKTVIKAPINAVIGVINSFIGGINKLKIPSWVPGVGGKGINISKIPYLEKGAVLEKGQTGFLEGNGAEAVVPLEKNKEWTRAVAEDMDSALGGASGGQVIALLAAILEVLEEFAGMGLYIDKKLLVGGLIKEIDRQQGQLQIIKGRG